MAVNDSSTLTSLLPSTPYLLAYSLPLFFLSVLLTFSGAFLTLDRTRSFPVDRYGVLPGAFEHKKRLHLILEGGIGGLPAASLVSFVVVWLLSWVITTFLASRWRYCVIILGGISGGNDGNLHTTLTLFAVLPIPRVQHSAMRFATASTGAFGLVLSIALLAKIPSWETVWGRLWEAQDLTGTWGTAKEKGLSAGFCLFLATGITCDWLPRRKFGECPDEKWDSYLANYAANAADRAGTFTPMRTFWDRRSVGPVRFQARVAGRKRDAPPYGRPVVREDVDDPLNSPPIDATNAKVSRPWLRQKMTMASSTPTLVDDTSANGKDIDFDKEVKRVRGPKTRYEDKETLRFNEPHGSNDKDPCNAVSHQALDRIAVAQKDAFAPMSDDMPEAASPRQEYKVAKLNNWSKGAARPKGKATFAQKEQDTIEMPEVPEFAVQNVIYHGSAVAVQFKDPSKFVIKGLSASPQLFLLLVSLHFRRRLPPRQPPQLDLLKTLPEDTSSSANESLSSAPHQTHSTHGYAVLLVTLALILNDGLAVLCRIVKFFTSAKHYTSTGLTNAILGRKEGFVVAAQTYQRVWRMDPYSSFSTLQALLGVLSHDELLLFFKQQAGIDKHTQGGLLATARDRLYALRGVPDGLMCSGFALAVQDEILSLGQTFQSKMLDTPGHSLISLKIDASSTVIIDSSFMQCLLLKAGSAGSVSIDKNGTLQWNVSLPYAHGPTLIFAEDGSPRGYVKKNTTKMDPLNTVDTRGEFTAHNVERVVELEGGKKWKQGVRVSALGHLVSDGQCTVHTLVRLNLRTGKATISYPPDDKVGETEEKDSSKDSNKDSEEKDSIKDSNKDSSKDSNKNSKPWVEDTYDFGLDSEKERLQALILFYGALLAAPGDTMSAYRSLPPQSSGDERERVAGAATGAATGAAAKGATGAAARVADYESRRWRERHGHEGVSFVPQIAILRLWNTHEADLPHSLSIKITGTCFLRAALYALEVYLQLRLKKHSRLETAPWATRTTLITFDALRPHVPTSCDSKNEQEANEEETFGIVGGNTLGAEDHSGSEQIRMVNISLLYWSPFACLGSRAYLTAE
ncbi:hypothetical protein GGX14DRAFT_665132 [Mycena pura]|uniref:Uncharacterized protein n=1 Tax=Mycena pura TaxID=153505 RepID=A0AAD6Y675_9AGAR|nr:hypothetical protein GGX14DRAFT_665132 [Mycena pura]